MQSSNLELAQQIADGGRGGNAAPVSLGRAVVEQHGEAFAGYAGGTLTVDVQNAITTASGSGGGLIYHDEERDPVRMPRRRLLIRDLLTRGRTSSDLVTYRKQVLRTPNADMVQRKLPTRSANTAGTRRPRRSRRSARTINISEEALSDARSAADRDRWRAAL